MEFDLIVVGINLGIFDLLEKDFMGVKEIADKIGVKCNLRNFIDLLDRLHVSGHLDREGILETSRYKSSNLTFVKSNPTNLITLVLFFNNILKEKLPKAAYYLKNDIAGEENVFNELYRTPEETERFLRSMAMIQQGRFHSIANKFDFKSYKTFIDIGGCLGILSAIIKKAHPHIQCINFDLPVVEQYFHNYMKETNMAGEVLYQAGDFFKDSFPECDVLAMGNILHDWNHEKKKLLFKKAYDCLTRWRIYYCRTLY